MFSSLFSWIWSPVRHTHVPQIANKLVLVLAVGMVFLIFLLRLDVKTNDDIFTYFNYARNTAEGRPFAIDYRNIPGEGFSSMLYMLLLVPFHILGTNPMLAGILLNLAAFLGIVLITAQIFRELYSLSPFIVSLSASVLGCIFLRNPDLIGIAGWAFETLYSPLFLSAILWLAAIQAKTHHPAPRHLLVVLLYACGVLTRPENALLFTPALAVYAFNFWGRWRVVASLFLYGIAFFVLLAAFKWLVFHDLFPTGYYRKFSNIDYGVASGKDYVLDWFAGHSRDIKITVAALIAFAFGGFLLRNQTPQRSFGVLAFYVALLATLILNIAFGYKTTPMVGINFRYLILGNYVLCFTLASVLILGCKWLASKLALRAPSLEMAMLAIAALGLPALMVYTSYAALGQTKALAKMAILDNVEHQVAVHPYLRFGRYLKAHIPNHTRLTISMGDGGAVPYAAECNTIDPVGLTEPFVARLANYKGDDRWKIYYDYLEGYKPDLLVIGMGTTGNAFDTTDECFPLSQKAVPPPDFVRYLREAGRENYTYISSISTDTAGTGMPYDVHLIVRRDSPMAKLLIKTCQDYSAMRGYTMVGNYTITCEGIVAVLPKYRL